MTDVTVSFLQQLSPKDLRPSAKRLRDGARIELARNISPEFSRFLYRSVGSHLNWSDRLTQTRQQWDAVLRKEGSETYVLYREGSPAGYVELCSEAEAGGTAVEIFYFGLFPEATGQGLGGVLLTEALRKAWSMHERWPNLAAVSRVWLHTCDLDGPAALPNYLARGFHVYRTETEDSVVTDASVGLWPEPEAQH
ncbi:GNAT family N-acetyltransferase [Glutamicibacter endophyticus]